MAPTQLSAFSSSLESAAITPPLGLREEFGGSRLLLSDLRLALMLLNRARHQAVARVLGPLPRDQANFVTLVAVLALMEAARDKVQPLLVGPALPAPGDTMLVGGSLREALLGVAGSPARETPFAGTLLTIAIVGASTGPVAIRSLRTIRGASHSAATTFHDRYGYIIDPGQWRQRRAARRLTRHGPS